MTGGGFGRLTTVVVLRSVAYFGVASLVTLFAIRHFHEPTAVGSATLVTFIGAGVIGTLGGRLAGRSLTARGRAAAWLRSVDAGAGAAGGRAGHSGPVRCRLRPSASCSSRRSRCRSRWARISCRTGSVWQAALPWAWPSRSAGLATPLFGLLADSGGLTTALAAIAAVPAIACALSFLVRDPARCAER